jgi:hypothetical protein
MAAPDKVENVLRLLNVLAALILIAVGVLEIMSFLLTSMILGSFVCFFGVALFALEFFTPVWIKTHCPFLYKHGGRGCTYLFLGALSIADMGFQLYLSTVVMVVGIIYILLSATKVPPLKPR